MLRTFPSNIHDLEHKKQVKVMAKSYYELALFLSKSVLEGKYNVDHYYFLLRSLLDLGWFNPTIIRKESGKKEKQLYDQGSLLIEHMCSHGRVYWPGDDTDPEETAEEFEKNLTPQIKELEEFIKLL